MLMPSLASLASLLPEAMVKPLKRDISWLRIRRLGKFLLANGLFGLMILDMSFDR